MVKTWHSRSRSSSTLNILCTDFLAHGQAGQKTLNVVMSRWPLNVQTEYIFSLSFMSKILPDFSQHLSKLNFIEQYVACSSAKTTHFGGSSVVSQSCVSTSTYSFWHESHWFSNQKEWLHQKYMSAKRVIWSKEIR